MKKLNLMFMSLLMAGMGIAFTACSSDNNDPKPEEMVLDADTLQVFDGFDVKFQMLDAQGRPVTKFKEGRTSPSDWLSSTSRRRPLNSLRNSLAWMPSAFSPPLVIILACHGTRLSKWEWQYISYTSRNRPQFHAGLSAKIVMNDLS